MKKTLLLFAVLTLSVWLVACNANRVFVEDDLYQTASNEYGFTEVYFFKIVDADTAFVLTGIPFQNSGLIAGRQGLFDKVIFVPKKVHEEMFVIPFPLMFSMSTIMDRLISLEDDEGNLLYIDPSGDYGGLSIGVSVYESLTEHNPELVFDTEIIFTFTTDGAMFHVASVSGECKIFSSENLLLD